MPLHSRIPNRCANLAHGHCKLIRPKRTTLKLSTTCFQVQVSVQRLVDQRPSMEHVGIRPQYALTDEDMEWLSTKSYWKRCHASAMHMNPQYDDSLVEYAAKEQAVQIFGHLDVQIRHLSF